MLKLRLPRVLWLFVLLAGAIAVPVLADNPDHRERLGMTGSCVDCDFTNADLSGLNATGNLSGSRFDGSKLYKANFKGANLKGASFAGADLTGANFTDALEANFQGASTDDTTTCPTGAAGPCR